MAVSSIFVLVLERMHARGHQVPRMRLRYQTFPREGQGMAITFALRQSILQRNLSP
jgi:hypothetical protein